MLLINIPPFLSSTRLLPLTFPHFLSSTRLPPSCLLSCSVLFVIRLLYYSLSPSPISCDVLENRHPSLVSVPVLCHLFIVRCDILRERRMYPVSMPYHGGTDINISNVLYSIACPSSADMFCFVCGVPLHQSPVMSFGNKCLSPVSCP